MRSWTVEEGACKHFNGLSCVKCDAGVEYATVKGPRDGKGISIPCKDKWNRHSLTCEKKQYSTPEEIANRNEARKHEFDCISRSLSPCCEAEIDSRWAIKDGRFKGHGGYFCSKCERLVYWV